MVIVISCCAGTGPLGQFCIPVLLAGEENLNLTVSFFPQGFREPLGRFDPGLVVVQAQCHLPQIRILLQHPHHGVLGCTAERNIAVLIPALRMQCDKRQHIHRGFEYIELIVRPTAVEAITRITACYISLEALSESVQPTFVCMTCNAVFIVSDEHGVVIFFGTVCGGFRAFIDQFCMDKSIQHLPADAAVLEKIGIHPAHGRADKRQ